MSARTRVLVLGSLPGRRSLAEGRYYAHPRNAFWHLAGAVTGREDLAALDYPARLALLDAVGLGLWDTVASAVRRGSLDAALRQAQAAPLAELVARLPDLRAIGFNGATAARIGRAALEGAGFAAGPPALLDLPSSSPAHAAMPPAEKRARWLALRPYLA